MVTFDSLVRLLQPAAERKERTLEQRIHPSMKRVFIDALSFCSVSTPSALEAVTKALLPAIVFL